MTTEDEQNFTETLANIFEDLQTFLIQKNNQHIIQAFLQIKKLSRRGLGSSNVSLGKKSVGSVSQKNYSQRKRPISGKSENKSIGQQSHASFDIIKGAEFFNQSRKSRSHYKKQYTEMSDYQQGQGNAQNDQGSRFTGPYISETNNQVLHRNNTPQIVPRLVGLVSSDQISDIEKPAGRSSRVHQFKGTERLNPRGHHYDRSIIEVENDDDQFQDIVLNRLDKIEEKVNQMLKNKKKLRVQTYNGDTHIPPPPLTPNRYYQPKTYLRNVNSGPNIISSGLRGHRNSEFYQYQQPSYKVSSGQMMPNSQGYPYDNAHKNLSSKSRACQSNGAKAQFTQRAHRLSSRILEQLPNYMTDNQQYAEVSRKPYRPSGLGVRQAQTVIFYEQKVPEEVQRQNAIIRDKRLGHYRESTGTIRYTTQSSNQQPHLRGQQVLGKQSDLSRIREQAFIDGQNVYKYIPMPKYVPQKTERHVITRKIQKQDDARQVGEQIYQHHQVGRVVFVDKQRRQVPLRNTVNSDNYSQRLQKVRDDLYYKSSKNSGVRQRQLQGSNLRAYTEHGDFVASGDDFSISSDQGIYSEIRQLREITRQHGFGKGERKDVYKNRKIGENGRVSGLKQYPVEIQQQTVGEDYRYHQKTQRNRHASSQNYSQHSGQQYGQEVIIERRPGEQRVYRVIRQSPSYIQKRQIRTGDRRSQVRKYQFIPNDKQAYYQTFSNKRASFQGNEPIYATRQKQQFNEHLPYQRKSKQSQFKTIVMNNNDDNRSVRKKLSTGSINTFKSIPYRQDSRKNFLNQRNIQFVEINSNPKNIEQDNQEQN